MLKIVTLLMEVNQENKDTMLTTIILKVKN